MTKADIATGERQGEVLGAIRAATAGTSWEGAEILPVSARTGEGVAALRDRIAAAAGNPVSRPAEARFRLAIDRVFSLAGVGVIVTGPVLSGSVRVGDRVMISPAGIPARVRSLHAQNRLAESGRAGERCALNLVGPGVDKDSIRRGDVALDPELHAPTDRIDAKLRLLGSESKPLSQGAHVRLHHGSAEVGARAILIGELPLAPGEEGFVQFALDRPIAATGLDPFVIRDASAQRTIGGGRIVDLRPALRRRRAPEQRARRAALANAEPVAALAALLEAPPFACDLAGFARDRALTAGQADGLATDLDLVVLEAEASQIAIARTRWGTFLASLEEKLAAHHAENPDVQGMGREQLRLSLQPRLQAASFTAALKRAAMERAIVLDGAFVRLATHEARMSAKDEALWASIALLLNGAARFRPPRVRDIAEATGRPEREVRRLMKLGSRMGRVDEAAHDHFFLRETIQKMAGIAAELSATAERGEFNAAAFRDRLDNGRKVAIQILEFFDRHGLTVRKGDMRRVDFRRLDLFGPLVHRTDRANGGESSPVGRSDFKSEWGSEAVSGGFNSRSPPPARTRTTIP